MPVQWNSRRPLVNLLVLTALALSACATPTAVPTVAPATAAASPTPVVVFTDAVGNAISPADVNDATHARLRVAVFDQDGPAIDFLIDGAVAVNGGRRQENIPAGYFTGYLYLAPGTYRVALALTGQGEAQALVPPQSLLAVAGHRYTLVLMGQVADHSLQPLLIDETAEADKLGATATDSVIILLNNLHGAASIESSWDGKMTNAPYGAFSSALAAPLVARGYVAVADDPAGALIGDPATDGSLSSTEPAIDFLFGFTGNYPGVDGRDYTSFQGGTTSELNAYDFLRGFNGKKLKIGGRPLSFATLVSAVETAGLKDLYASGGPLILIAPTDEAFAAMLAIERDALLADPAALRQLLLAHTIPAFVPRGGLAETPGAAGFRVFTNLAGDKLVLGYTPEAANGTGLYLGGYTVNTRPIGDFDTYYVAHGSVIFPAYEVRLP